MSQSGNALATRDHRRTQNNWFVPGVINWEMRQKGRSSSWGLSYHVWPRGHSKRGVGKRGQGGKRGVNQKRHNEGLQLWVRTGVSFSVFASLGWSLSQAAAAAGPLWQARRSTKGSILESAIRYCSLGQLLCLLFSHGYSLMLGLHEIIFQPGDNVRFSGSRTFMSNPINPRCSFCPSAYLIV